MGRRSFSPMDTWSGTDRTTPGWLASHFRIVQRRSPRIAKCGSISHGLFFPRSCGKLFLARLQAAVQHEKGHPCDNCCKKLELPGATDRCKASIRDVSVSDVAIRTANLPNSIGFRSVPLARPFLTYP